MDEKSSLALKKKRELLGSISKRKMSLRKHIDSLKQNECRLDITQITKYVFLGSLCLKPVPQLFDSPILLEELDMKVGNVKNTEEQIIDENFDQPTDFDKKRTLKNEIRKRNGKKKCLQIKKKSLRERNEPKSTLYSELQTIKNENSDTTKRKNQDINNETIETPVNVEITENLNTDNSSPQNTKNSPFELIMIKEQPEITQNNDTQEDILELFDQNNPTKSADLTDYENERLKGALTPELILLDSDDDTIDQLMFNIMDIKIGPNVFDKDFGDIPSSEIEEFENKADSPDSMESTNPDKKFIKRTPQCKICSQVFPSYIRLKKHRAAHNGDKPYLCLKCGENHTTLEQLIAHLRTHQGKRPYVCKKCNKGFKTMKALENHQPVHVLRKVVPPKKTFKCEVCGKEFRKLCDLERHTRVHTGEKPSVCNICNRRFQQAHNLNKHLLIHTQEKPFQCDICNKKFGRNDVLNRHLLTHSVKKPNRCEICMKSFIRISQLLAHKEKYHPSKENATEFT